MLGRGSFGRVYKALHKETGHFAAVKVMNSFSLKIEQIQQEIGILKRSDHKNIIKYLDCSDPSYVGKPYIIFEFVENGSLKDVVKKFGVFSEELVKRYLTQVIYFIYLKFVCLNRCKLCFLLFIKNTLPESTNFLSLKGFLVYCKA